MDKDTTGAVKNTTCVNFSQIIGESTIVYKAAYCNTKAIPTFQLHDILPNPVFPERGFFFLTVFHMRRAISTVVVLQSYRR